MKLKWIRNEISHPGTEVKLKVELFLNWKYNNLHCPDQPPEGASGAGPLDMMGP